MNNNVIEFLKEVYELLENRKYKIAKEKIKNEIATRENTNEKASDYIDNLVESLK